MVYHWVLGGSLLNHDSFFSPTSQLILVSWSPGICLLGHNIPPLKFHWSSDNPQTSTMQLCSTKITPMYISHYCSTCMHLSNTFCHHRSIQHVSGSVSHTSLVSFMSHRCRLRVSHGSHVTAAEATLFYLPGSVDYATLCLMNLMIEYGEHLEVKRIQKGNSLSRLHSTPMTTASSTSTTMAVAFWRKPRGRMTSLYTSLCRHQMETSKSQWNGRFHHRLISPHCCFSAFPMLTAPPFPSIIMEMHLQSASRLLKRSIQSTRACKLSRLVTSSLCNQKCVHPIYMKYHVNHELNISLSLTFEFFHTISAGNQDLLGQLHSQTTSTCYHFIFSSILHK